MTFAVQRKKIIMSEVVLLGHCEHFLIGVLPEITLSFTHQKKKKKSELVKKTDRKQTYS